VTSGDSRAQTSAVEVTAELVTDLVRLGGYTHPLFTGETAVPVPGQGLLLLMGGLVEQSGLLDHAVALLELRRVRFLAMVYAGSSLRVAIEEQESTPKSGGKALVVYRWTALDPVGRTVAEAEAVMLVRGKTPVDVVEGPTGPHQEGHEGEGVVA